MFWSVVIRSLVLSALLIVLAGCVLSFWLTRGMGPKDWLDVEVLNRSDAPVEVVGIDRVPDSAFGVIAPGQSVTKHLRLGKMSPGNVTLNIRRPDGSLVSQKTDSWVDSDVLTGDSICVLIRSVSP